MEDRFKFRIWDKKLKKLAKWGDNPYHNMEIMNYICVENPVTDWRHEDYILMQCTGLKDKNGKLIYEGDIVKQGDIKYVVNWLEGTFCFLELETTYNFTIEYVMPSKQEAIGNIYENPELLED